MKTKILMAFIAALFSLKTQATVIIVPGFDYFISGSTKQTYTSSGTTANLLDHTLSGYSMSLKVGYSFAGLAIGAVGSRSYVEREAQSTTMLGATGTKDYSWRSKVGGFIGYRLPIMLSFGASYLVPMVEDGYTGPESSDLALNVGYSILPMVQLTFTYQMAISAKYYSSGTAYDLPATTDGGAIIKDDFEMSTMSIGISVPLGF